MGDNAANVDLVGGPFAVVESDPGLFTTLIRSLGIHGLQVEEVYDIQPWALDQLRPKGLVLCFTWQHDRHPARAFRDPAAKDIWFANQLIDDACASLAILNVLFNCPGVQLGEELEAFKAETAEMSPKMKGLAISNSKLLRESQNTLARPADLRGALNAIAASASTQTTKKPSRKRAKFSSPDPRHRSSKKSAPTSDDADDGDTYHFIGYVPAHGKVWELDGLKAGPLEVGELPDPGSTRDWESVVRPALRLKMEKYGATGAAAQDAETAAEGNIQFNLLALVPDKYEIKSDELELLKRERSVLERRLGEAYGDAWRGKVDQDLLNNVDDALRTQAHPSSRGTHGAFFAPDIGSRKLQKELSILQMPFEDLPDAWNTCIASALSAKIAVDEEIQNALDARAESIRRTFDYEPFIREYITALHDEGLLAQCMDDSDES